MRTRVHGRFGAGSFKTDMNGLDFQRYGTGGRFSCMDFGNPWSLFSSVIIGLIGMAFFIYGKKQTNLRCIGAGVVMCVFPYFVTSVAAMWLITAACIGGVWAAGKYL